MPARLNNACRRLGSGWSRFVEAQRHEAATDPGSTFADAASALIGAERNADFEEATIHFELIDFFVYLPPTEDKAVTPRIEQLTERHASMRRRLGELETIGRQLEASPDRQLSLTDSDARAMATGSDHRGVVGYNLQAAR